jgi:hypothetical protein
LIVSRTQALHASCAAVGLPLNVHGFHPVQVSVKVTISGVRTIDPDESTRIEIRFLTGWADAGTAIAITARPTAAGSRRRLSIVRS